jgi:hypothetical protein
MFKDHNKHLIWLILLINLGILIIAWYATDKLIQENVKFLGLSANGSTKAVIISLLIAFNYYSIRSILKHDTSNQKMITDIELKRIEQDKQDIQIQIIVHEKGNQTAYINTPTIKINFPTEIKIFTANPVNIILPRTIIGKELILNAEKVGYRTRKPLVYFIENNDKPIYIYLIQDK